MVAPQHGKTQPAAECSQTPVTFPDPTARWLQCSQPRREGYWYPVSSVLTNYQPKETPLTKVLWTREGLLEPGAEHTHTHTSLGQKHTVGGEAAKRAGALLEHLL